MPAPSRRECSFCTYKFTGDYEFCPSCGYQLKPDQQSNNPEVNLDRNLLQEYKRLKQEISEFNGLQTELNEKLISKEQDMTQIQNTDQEIMEVKARIDDKREELVKIESGSMKIMILSILGQKSKLLEETRQHIENLQQDIVDLENRKKEFQRAFFRKLKEIEELQKQATNHQMKVRHFDEILNQLSRQLIDPDKQRLEQEISQIEHRRKLLNTNSQQIVTAIENISEVVREYKELRLQYLEAQNTHIRGQELGSQLSQLASVTKLRKHAREVDAYTEATYAILREISLSKSIWNLSDFETLFKYVRTFFGDLENKFKSNSNFQSDLEISLTHALKIKDWMEKELYKIDQLIKVARLQQNQLELNLDQSIRHKIERQIRAVDTS